MSPLPLRSPKVVAVASLGVALVLAGAAWWLRGSATTWRSGFTVEGLRGTMRRDLLEVCAHGHFDQGLLGEVFYALHLGPTDQGRSDCARLTFVKAPTLGTFTISAEGKRSVGGRTDGTPFSPRAGHAVGLKRVWFDTECFCIEATDQVGLDGTLTLTAVEPTPQGRLTLEVGGTKDFPPARIDVSLDRLTWDTDAAY